MAAILFHDFTIDDSDLSFLLLSTSARIFSVVQQHVAFLDGIDHSAIADDVPAAAEHERHMIGECI
jgi:hypothetical protein